MSQINKVSNATKDAIKRKSAYALPDRPSDMGMKPEDIKRAFWQPIVDVTFSAISEIDRLIDELNTIMTGNYDAHIADKNNPHAVTKAQVGLGNCNNTADADKPVSTPQKTALNTHNTATDAHSDIRTAIINGLAKKVGYTEVIDGFTSTEVDKPLSAYRGKVLYDSLQETIDKADYAIKNISLNSENGILTITRTDGTNFTIDLPLEYIVKSGSYNASTKNIELVLDNDEKIEIPVGALVKEYYGDGTTVTLYIDSADGNKPKFKISDTYKNKIDNALVSSDLNNFLTVNTAQEITATKTFNNSPLSMQLNAAGITFTAYSDSVKLQIEDSYQYTGSNTIILPRKDGTLATLDDISTTVKSILSAAFPVGTTVMSPTNPASVIGGSWQQESSGKFFRTAASQTSNTTDGGSTTHRHNFQIGLPFWYGVAVGDDFTGAGAYKYSTGQFAGTTSIISTSFSTKRNSALTENLTSLNTSLKASQGDTDTANTLPTYKNRIFWTRIA